MSPFFSKWLIDLVDDSQSFRWPVPSVRAGCIERPVPRNELADAGISTIHRSGAFTATRAGHEQHYANMARYIDYLHRTSKDFIRGQGAVRRLGKPRQQRQQRSHRHEPLFRARHALIASEMAGAIRAQRGREEVLKAG